MKNTPQEQQCDIIIPAILQEMEANPYFTISLSDSFLTETAKRYLFAEHDESWVSLLTSLGFAEERRRPKIPSLLLALPPEKHQAFWKMYEKYRTQAATQPCLPESLSPLLRELLQPYIDSFQKKIHGIYADPPILAAADIESSKEAAYLLALQEFDDNSRTPEARGIIQLCEENCIPPKELLKGMLRAVAHPPHIVEDKDWAISIAAVQKEVYMQEAGIKERDWLPSYCDFLIDVPPEDEVAAKEILGFVVEQGKEAVLENWSVIAAIAKESGDIIPEFQKAMEAFPPPPLPLHATLAKNIAPLLDAVAKEITTSLVLEKSKVFASRNIRPILKVAAAYHSLVLCGGEHLLYPHLQGIIFLGFNAELAQAAGVPEAVELAHSIQKTLKGKKRPCAVKTAKKGGPIILPQENNTVLKFLEHQHEKVFEKILAKLRKNFLGAALPRWTALYESLSQLRIRTPELQDILEKLEMPHHRHKQAPHLIAIEGFLNPENPVPPSGPYVPGP